MITDDDLILFYYGDELDADTTAQIEAALCNDAGLRDRYQALRADLDAMKNLAVSAPQSAKTNWLNTLDQAAAAEGQQRPQAVGDAPGNRAKPKRSKAGPGWLTSGLFLQWGRPAMAAVLVLGVGIMIGLGLKTESEMPGPAIVASAAQPPEFTQVMRAYLKQAETQLVSLDATQNGQRAALLDEIISRNRLYVLAAERSQAPELARVLRAFEPVLNTLADPEATPAQITLAQQQLVFEMGAMLTKLSPAASKAVHPTTHNL